ncbi:PLP-dependent aminotransferase family protein [Streptomyces diacarni]|uniref:aminotransferase-like domain-containing protein n=1 Tax=Streptomyces diacarni TaxID=2800381 RepID=UPI0033C5AFCF
MSDHRDQTRADLLIGDLHPALTDPTLEAMNFLNEVAGRFPDAVSFAAGRPCEEFFELDALPRYLLTFQEYLESEKGADADQVRRMFFQYGRTKGIIHELVAEHLAVDEGIAVDPESIVVTVGCQEAMFLTLRALCADAHDVVLAVSPSYIGLTGAARLLDREVWPVRETTRGVDLAHLVEQIEAARAVGKRPRAFYLVPDFANPSGLSMDLDSRKALLSLAAEYDLLLLEDNPYGLFQAEDGTRLPTLKALDTDRRVVYLGSLAKTCFPGARIGFVVADQRVDVHGTAPVLLADQMSKIKSMLTVNTPSVAQAMAGGKLLEHGCSLVKANSGEMEVYRRNLRLLLHGLEQRFPAKGPLQVTWNRPTGGFFVVVTVPFAADEEALEYSAQYHGVLWTPMRHFYDGSGGDNQLRLSLSAVSPQQIDIGLDRLLSLVADLDTKENETR